MTTTSAVHRIIRRGEAAHWDHAFDLRPNLTHIDVSSHTHPDGDVERDIDTYETEYSTPLGITAMDPSSSLREVLYQCWAIDYPQDFEES